MMAGTMRVQSLVAAGLCAILSLWTACAPAATEPPKTSAPPAEAREVRVAVAAHAVWPFVLRATGQTVADEDATLAAKVAGRVESVAVDLGTVVKRGDTVARIEARDLELRVEQSEAALAAARTLLGLSPDGDDAGFDPETSPAFRSALAELADARRERQRLAELSASGVASRADLDRADARLAMAEAALQDARQTTENRRAIVQQRKADLALARQTLTDAAIAAPFDGAVAARLASTGDYLGVGDPIARLVRFDPLRVRVQVPERDAHLVAIGQVGRVEVAGLGSPREARVVRLAPALQDASRTLLVELELANADLALRPGSFAAVDLVVDPARTALAIPLDALVSFAGVEKVFLVERGVATERRIQVGRRDAVRVEVVSGLEPGAQVVLSPGNLRGGAAVRVAR